MFGRPAFERATRSDRCLHRGESRRFDSVVKRLIARVCPFLKPLKEGAGKENYMTFSFICRHTQRLRVCNEPVWNTNGCVSLCRMWLRTKNKKTKKHSKWENNSESSAILDITG